MCDLKAKIVQLNLNGISIIKFTLKATFSWNGRRIYVTVKGCWLCKTRNGQLKRFAVDLNGFSSGRIGADVSRYVSLTRSFKIEFCRSSSVKRCESQLIRANLIDGVPFSRFNWRKFLLGLLRRPNSIVRDYSTVTGRWFNQSSFSYWNGSSVGIFFKNYL